MMKKRVKRNRQNLAAILTIAVLMLVGCGNQGGQDVRMPPAPIDISGTTEQPSAPSAAPQETEVPKQTEEPPQLSAAPQETEAPKQP